MNLPKVMEIRGRLSDLKLIMVVGGKGSGGTVDYGAAIEKTSDAFAPLDTRADDPALIIYTSGTRYSAARENATRRA